MTLTRPLTFLGPRGGTFAPGTPCRYARPEELDDLGRRLRKRMGPPRPPGSVLVVLEGVCRWVPQDALSTWRPLTRRHGAWVETPEGRRR